MFQKNFIKICCSIFQFKKITSTAAAIVSFEVPSCVIISNNIILSTGLKQCMPITLSGRFEASAIFLFYTRMKKIKVNIGIQGRRHFFKLLLRDRKSTCICSKNAMFRYILLNFFNNPVKTKICKKKFLKIISHSLLMLDIDILKNSFDDHITIFKIFIIQL